MGNGTFATAASVLSAGSALKAASNGGVTSAQGAATSNPIKNIINCFKVTPASAQQSVLNAQGNIATWTSGVIHANSNALRNLTRNNQIMSKANDVQAYRFNPAGTPDEVVANNPGVFVGDDGNYYLPNKWSPNEPYLIDTTKEQMIMMYGGDDMAVCDGTVFGKSYVDTTSFKSDGSLNYQEPADLPYGQVVDVTKQAAGSYAIAPEGTQVQSLEGIATVGKGDVIAVDSLGNPYTQPAVQTLTKNTGFTIAQQQELLKTAGIEGIHLEYNNPLTNAASGVKSVNMTINGNDFSIDPSSFEDIANYESVLKNIFSNVKTILKASNEGKTYIGLK